MTGKINRLIFLLLLIPFSFPLPDSVAQTAQKFNWQTEWEQLAADSPTRMFPAFQNFVKHPQASLPFLEKVMKPVVAPDDDTLERCIDNLDNELFVVRVEAHQTLKEMGFRAEAALRRAMSQPDSNEMKVRARKLLSTIDPKRGAKERRFWRGIEILEQIGTKKARAILQNVAEGADGFWRTREAKRSIERLQNRRIAIVDSNPKTLHTFKGHSGNVYSVAISPDNRLVASGSSDDTVRLWDARTGRALATLGRHNNVYAICFSQDGRRVFTGGSSPAISIWDTVAQKKAGQLTGHTSTVRDLALSPDGKLLASASYDDTVKLWDVKTGKCIRTMNGYGSNVYTVAFSPDGTMLASGSSDDAVRVWDVAGGTIKHVLNGHTSNVYSAVFSGDGKTVISSDSSGRVIKWDLLTVKSKHVIYRNAGYRYMTIHPNGRTIAFGGGGTAILRDAVTDAFHSELSGHSGMIRDVAFSADGQWMATASYDDTIRLWRVGKDVDGD